MHHLAERGAEDLRRRLIEQRRAMVTLTAELRRLADARLSAPPAQREQLLADINRVASAHHEAALAIDDLSDALIRQDRIRAAKRAPRARSFRRAQAH